MLIEVKELNEEDSPGGAPTRGSSLNIPVSEAPESTAPASAPKPSKSAKITVTAISDDDAAPGTPAAKTSKPAATTTANKSKRPAKPPAKQPVKPATPQPAATAKAKPTAQIARKITDTIAAQANNTEGEAVALTTAQAAPAQAPLTPPTASTTENTPVEAAQPEPRPLAALEALPTANPLHNLNKDLPKTITLAKQSVASTGSNRLLRAWHHTRKRRVAAVLLVLFALYNGLIFAIYHGRSYPNTTIDGHMVGSHSSSELAGTISKLPLLPKDLTLHYNSTHHTVTPSALGMRVDAEQTARSLMANRSWLPIINQLRAPHGLVVISVNPKPYEQTIQKIGAQYRTTSVDARIELRGGDFKLVPQIDAQTIDSAASQAAIVEALSAGRTDAQLHLRSAPPKVTNASLQSTLQKYQAQRNTAITLAAASGNKTKQFSPAQIGTWFVAGSGPNQFTLDDDKVANAVIDGSLELSVTPDDSAAIAELVTKSVESTQARRIKVTGTTIGHRSFTFCTNARGVPQSEVKELGRKTTETLNDKRGWSLGGNITFNQVTTGCAFTIWLTAPAQMSSFGEICDAMWSCEVTPNVVINRDRWTKTTEPWLKALGNNQLQLYRSMAINHEVGHWLGFGHSGCPVAGQPAPVMEQQSINLQGCVFNAWPTVTERLALKNALGL